MHERDKRVRGVGANNGRARAGGMWGCMCLYGAVMGGCMQGNLSRRRRRPASTNREKM
ncbi:hypothetical protein BV25DRAFT_1605353 [Artomyces pyxidatus]|uniref:Uncharacterized protein n=1 Tax=Artomyces pyxidatus TaxID=48021 RepID=A0ACB8TCF2_9AGAM|nr:hypothetical protein BV25DRAFT_1605353 [Artomyces pyxidatus]